MPDELGRDEEFIRWLVAKQLSRRELMVAAGGMTLAGALAACAPFGGTASASPASTNATLTAGLVELGIQSPDPHIAENTGPERPVALAIAEGLVRRDLNGKLIPNLATSWSISPDSLTWTFTLRGGVPKCMMDQRLLPKTSKRRSIAPPSSQSN